MEFEHDEELLDWNMQTDENFDDILNEDKQNLHPMTRNEQQEISEQEKQAKSPEHWVQFGPKQFAYPIKHERRSGDGDSVSSEDQGKRFSDPERKDASYLKSKKLNRENSFAKCVSPTEESGLSKFRVLDEEDVDIEGYDVSPVEFRGTLSTGNPSYKSNGSSCFCKVISYLIAALLALAFGVLIGYYISVSNQNVSNVKVDTSHEISTRVLVVTTDATGLQNCTKPLSRLTTMDQIVEQINSTTVI